MERILEAWNGLLESLDAVSPPMKTFTYTIFKYALYYKINLKYIIITIITNTYNYIKQTIISAISLFFYQSPSTYH